MSRMINEYLSQQKNNNGLFYIILLVFIDALISIYFENLTIFFSALLFHLILFFIGTKIGFSEKIIAITLIISYIYILFLYFGYIYKYGEPYYMGGSDDYHFEGHAIEFATNKIFDFKTIDYILKHKYNAFVGNGFIFLLTNFIRLINIFGEYHTIIFRIFNIHCLILGSMLLISSVDKNKSYINYWYSFLFIICLFPRMLYISSHVFRDTIIYLLFMTLFYVMMYFKNTKFIFSFVISLALGLLRTEYFIVSMAIVFFIYFMNIKKRKNQIMFLVFSFGVSLFAIIKFDLFSVLIKKMFVYNDYLGSSSGIAAKLFSIPILPFGIIFRIIYALITPLPHLIFITNFEVESLISFINTIGTYIMIFLIPYWIKSFNFKTVWPWISIFFLTVICMTTFTFRHFILFYPLMLILGLKQKIDTIDADIISKNTLYSTGFVFTYLILYAMITISRSL